ncbi:MAG: hypothetical protein EHM64_08590 [Ignavibacteriae bacterium]|nr:MAG: hypothetical protein EHM64_08590 [Ignavibacteriota bacterium]
MKNSMFKNTALVIVMLLAYSLTADAHCDTMEGPVVKAAKKALDTGNINLVLVWVQEKDAIEIKKAFERTRSVRTMSPQVKEMADMYFFETLVRVHRAGEGAPYTGLKSAGTGVEPGIEMADQAVVSGSGEALVKNLNAEMQKGLHTLFTEVREKKNYRPEDVNAGREYVKAYVTFIHFVERLYQAAQIPSEGHGHEVPDAGSHQH